MSDVIEGMEAVTVHIRDIQRARKFYSEVLGLREVSYVPAASRAAYEIPGTTTLLTMHVLGEGGGSGTRDCLGNRLLASRSKSGLPRDPNARRINCR